MRTNRRTFLAGVSAATALSTSRLAFGEKKYDTGATDTEIKIGQTMPYSGPASALSGAGRAHAAYFSMVNDQGGINGRKIRLISLDTPLGIVCMSACKSLRGYSSSGRQRLSLLTLLRIRNVQRFQPLVERSECVDQFGGSLVAAGPCVEPRDESFIGLRRQRNAMRFAVSNVRKASRIEVDVSHLQLAEHDLRRGLTMLRG